jgi:hypothetical protein
MAYEIELILRFQDLPPTQQDIEELLDCDVVEFIEEEV